MNLEKIFEIEVWFPSSYDHVKQFLEMFFETQPERVKFSMGTVPSPFRSIETAIVIAVISTTGVVMAALITGLLKQSQQAKQRKIRIRSKSGVEIEYPADLPKESIDELINKLKELEGPQILL